MSDEQPLAHKRLEADELLPAVSKRQYQSLMQATAFLEREFRGREASDDFIAKGGEIKLVFDSNIFYSYAAPFSQGRITGGRRGFGQFLPRRVNVSTSKNDEQRKKIIKVQQSEDRDAGKLLQTLVKIAIGSNHADTDGPFLQFTRHAEETQKYREKLTGNIQFTHDQSSERRKKLSEASSKALDLFLKRKNKKLTPEKYLDITQDVLARVEEAGGLSPEVQIERINSLLGWEKNPNVVRVEDSDLGYWPRNRSDYLLAEHILIETFGATLTQHRDPISRERDIDALKELALANRYHIETKDNSLGYGARLLLVTCDKEISIAAHRAPRHLRENLSDHVLSFFNRDSQAPSERLIHNRIKEMESFFGLSQGIELEERWFNAFSLHYIRNISAYLSDLEHRVSDTVHTAPYKELGLFETVFMKSFEHKELPISRLNDIIFEPTDPRNVVIPKEFEARFIALLDRWKKFLSQTLGNQVSESLITETQKRSLAKRFSEFTKSRENSKHDHQFDVTNEAKLLSALLVDYVERSRDRMVLEFSSHGTELAALVGQTSQRTPPDLYFKSLPQSFGIFRRLAEDARYPGSAEWRTDFDLVAEVDCASNSSDDRWESHLKFLILAASSAGLERWSIARSHVYRALEILSRAEENHLPAPTTKPDSNPSGREARFLLCFCERMLADNQQDLDRAEAAFAASLEAHTKDKHDPKDSASLSTLRYENEALSIALSRYYLQRRVDCRELSNNSEAPHPFDYQFESCRKQIKHLLTCFEKLQVHTDFQKLKIPMHHSQMFGMQNQMLEITLISVATNIVQLAVIDRFWTDKGQPGLFQSDGIRVVTGLVETHLKDALLYLESAAGGKWIEASLTVVYRRVALTMLDEANISDSAGPRLTANNHEDFFRKWCPREMSKIDQWRYEALHDFVRSLSTARSKDGRIG